MQQSDLEREIWDCIVVGAGIEGSNTARYSASLGKKTLCLEQVCVVLASSRQSTSHSDRSAFK